MAKLLPFLRLTLLLIFAGMLGAYIADQYAAVRDMVRFLCINCLGLGD